MFLNVFSTTTTTATTTTTTTRRRVYLNEDVEYSG